MTDNPIFNWASPEDGPALAAEAQRLTEELHRTRTLKPAATAAPTDIKTYRAFIKDRLRTIRRNQKILCPTCNGTGTYTDMHLIHLECQTCGRTTQP